MTAPRRLYPDSTVEIVLAGIASGRTVNDACTNAGIHRTTFYEWLNNEPGLSERYALAIAEQTRSRFCKTN